MVTAIACILTALAAAAWAAYAIAVTLPGGHHGGRGRPGCMRRHAVYRVTRAAYGAAIWAAGTARRVRPEKSRT